MTSSVWDTAAELALALAETPHFCDFLRVFDLTGRPDDLAHRVSDMTARYSPLRTNPALLGTRLNMVPAVESLMRSDADAQWLERAIECGTAFQVLIEGIRADLPGYPVLRVPHVRPGSPHEMGDPFLFRGFPWDAELRRLGLQSRGLPPTMAGLGGSDLIGLQRELHRAIRDREAWQSFKSARKALTATDRAALSALGKEFESLVHLSVVDEEAGDLLIPRLRYREAVLEEIVGRTTGRIGSYLKAFETIDLFITVVASFMETMLKDGELLSLEPHRLALGHGIDIRNVDFAVRGDQPFMTPGEAVVLSTPMPFATGVVYPTAITHKWGRLNDPASSRMVITGKLAA